MENVSSILHFGFPVVCGYCGLMSLPFTVNGVIMALVAAHLQAEIILVVTMQP